MAFRVLTLVVMVLLLALPHPGNRVAAAGFSSGAGHVHHLAPAGSDAAEVYSGAGHDRGPANPACIPLCVGTSLNEPLALPQAAGKLVVLWAGFGGPVSRALAAPPTPLRPPNGAVSV